MLEGALVDITAGVVGVVGVLGDFPSLRWGSVSNKIRREGALVDDGAFVDGGPTGVEGVLGDLPSFRSGRPIRASCSQNEKTTREKPTATRAHFWLHTPDTYSDTEKEKEGRENEELHS